MRFIEIGCSATSEAAYGRNEINFIRLDWFMHAKMCHLPSLRQLCSILHMQQLNIDQKQSRPNNAQCNRVEMCTNTMSALLNRSSLAFCFVFFLESHTLLASQLIMLLHFFCNLICIRGNVLVWQRQPSRNPPTQSRHNIFKGTSRANECL